MTPIYVVYYRTGGTDNFQWHTLRGFTEDEARTKVAEITLAGRVAHMERENRFHGVPDTYGSREVTEREIRGARITLGLV